MGGGCCSLEVKAKTRKAESGKRRQEERLAGGKPPAFSICRLVTPAAVFEKRKEPRKHLAKRLCERELMTKAEGLLLTVRVVAMATGKLAIVKTGDCESGGGPGSAPVTVLDRVGVRLQVLRRELQWLCVR